MLNKTVVNDENYFQKGDSFFMKKIAASLCCVLIAYISTIFGVPFLSVKAEEFAVSDIKSACLMDYASGEILYQHNADERLPVASMVKLMTILLTFEAIDEEEASIDDMVHVSENASGMGGSQVFIDPHCQYKLEDLLKSVIVASANDASVALAEHLAGSENEFVLKMNNRASELGMKNTHYSNCTGLPAAEQYSCARDTSILNRELLSHENYHKYSTIWMETLVHPSGRETGLVNTNKLIRYYKDCDGGKTGSTNEAGYCLSATAMRGGMRLISTVCGANDSKNRFNQCSSMFNYGFANFENKKIIDTQTAYTTLKVLGSKTSTVDLFAKNDYYALIKKSEKSTEYSYSVKCDESISAPAQKGDCVGELIIVKGGQEVGRVELVVGADLEKLTFKDSIKKIASNWSL